MLQAVPMSWEENKQGHAPRRFLENISSVGDAMDAGSTHTRRDIKRKDDLNEESTAVAVVVAVAMARNESQGVCGLADGGR